MRIHVLILINNVTSVQKRSSFWSIFPYNQSEYVPEKNSAFRHFSRSDKFMEILNCTEMHGLSHAFVSLSITFKFTVDIDNFNMHLLYLTSLIRCFLKPFNPYVPFLLSVTWKSIFKIYTLELNFKNCS